MPENELEPVRPDKRTAPIVSPGGPLGRSRRVRRAGSRRQGVIALFTLVVIAGLIAAAYYWFMPQEQAFTVNEYTSAAVVVRTIQNTVERSGVVESRRTASVTTPERGFVSRLLVDEGDWVTAGQVLVRVDARDLGDQLASLERSYERSRRDYDRYLLSHAFNLQGYDRKRANLLVAIEDAEESLAATRELQQIGSVSLRELREAERKVSTAYDALADHDADVDQAISLHRLSVQNYEDDLQATRGEIDALGARIAATTIAAPITGRVIAVSAAARNTGELVAQYATLVELADTRNPLVRATIEEQYVASVSVGQPVAVEISGSRVAGAIERIGQTAATGSDGGTVVELTVAIDIGSSEVLPGSSALAEVLLGEIPDALVLPRGPFLTSGNRRYLYVVEDGTARRVPVEFGLVTTSLVQITSGVRAGDQIITSSYQNYIDRQEIILGGRP